MLRSLRARMTYANVVSSLALFLVVSGGTALAAATITGDDIVDESITGVDIQNSSLESGDVANGSLTGLDVSDGSIASADVVNSSLTGTDVMDGSILTSDIGNTTIIGADVANSTLSGGKIADGTITGADVAVNSLSGARITDATISGTDIGQGTLTGADMAAGTVTSRELKAPEGWHWVGTSGEVGFHQADCGSVVCEWKAADGSIGYYADPYGVVRLQGTACYAPRYSYTEPGSGACKFEEPAAGGTLFVLPAAYRPANTLTIRSADGIVVIRSTGGVSAQDDSDGLITLDGIDFRAG
jgi:hypothetical protein